MVLVPVRESNIAALQKLSEWVISTICPDADRIPPTEYHLSLSRPVSLKSHLIDSFLSDVTNSIGTGFRGLNTLFLSPVVTTYSNSDGTHKYFGIPVDLDASPRCLDLIRVIDVVYSKYGLESYFSEASPHVSVCFHKPAIEVSPSSILGQVEVDTDQLDITLEELRIDFTAIHIQIGNSIHAIPL